MNLPLKQQRFLAEQQNSWPTEDLDDQLIQQLYNDLAQPGFPDDLYQNLVSHSQKKNIEAANFIKNNLSTAQEISDLLIKWCFWKMFNKSNDTFCTIILEMML